MTLRVGNIVARTRQVMVVYLRSGSALQRLVAGLVLSAWARRTPRHDRYPPALLAQVSILLIYILLHYEIN